MKKHLYFHRDAVSKGATNVCSWRIPGGYHIRFGSEILGRFSYRLASSGNPKHRFNRNIRLCGSTYKYTPKK